MNKKLTLELLNEYALERVNRYLNLRIKGLKVPCPFYLNFPGSLWKKAFRRAGATKEMVKKARIYFENREFAYGWLNGKGTPEEIENAAEEMLEKIFPKFHYYTETGIDSFLRSRGIGIDCSGFVFNVLHQTFIRVDLEEEFMSSLSWKANSIRRASRAGVYIFSGDSSRLVDPTNTRPMDLLAMRIDGKLEHVSLVLDREGTLAVAQSIISSKFSGVTLSDIYIRNNKPIFIQKKVMGPSWDDYWNQGILEFRRLKCVEQVLGEI